MFWLEQYREKNVYSRIIDSHPMALQSFVLDAMLVFTSQHKDVQKGRLSIRKKI